MTELTLEKTTARRLYPEAPKWFQKVLNESFGEDFFSQRKFTDIKTFEDACNELGIDPEEEFNGTDLLDEVAYKKLKIIVKAINQDWEPDWDNTNQRKYWPYFKLSSGFGFSDSDYNYGLTHTFVGSRLCFETEEKCTYAAKQFIDIYEQFLTIKKIKIMAKKSAKNQPVFDFRTIKSFEDACAKQNVDPEALPDLSMIPEDIRKPIISAYKLMIIFLAINNGWRPDWSNSSQGKYYPWYLVLSSGFGFSYSGYYCAYTITLVGSRLCTDTSEKALYIAKQFKTEYQEYFLYSE